MAVKQLEGGIPRRFLSPFPLEKADAIILFALRGRGVANTTSRERGEIPLLDRAGRVAPLFGVREQNGWS